MKNTKLERTLSLKSGRMIYREEKRSLKEGDWGLQAASLPAVHSA